MKTHTVNKKLEHERRKKRYLKMGWCFSVLLGLAMLSFITQLTAHGVQANLPGHDLGISYHGWFLPWACLIWILETPSLIESFWLLFLCAGALWVAVTAVNHCALEALALHEEVQA